MIKVYTTDCPKCKMLERKLTELGYEYEVSRDIQIIIDKGFRSAPVMEMDGRFFNYESAMLVMDHIEN